MDNNHDNLYDAYAMLIALGLHCRSTVYLHDGRTLDVTGLTLPEAIACLRDIGATPDDIRVTVHVIPRGALSMRQWDVDTKQPN